MTARVRIRRIQVTKLFGVFDHDIPLNLHDRITIIHGPNGYGKTVILKMVEAMFSGQWEPLFNVPFGDMTIEMEDGGVLQVKPTPPTLDCSYREHPDAELLSGIVERREKPALEQIDRRGNAWQLRPMPIWTLDGEILEAASDQEGSRVNEPDWWGALRARLRVHLIHTQRLGVIGDKHPAVRRDSNELAAGVKSLLAKYASHSQELDSTFLDRLLQEDKAAPPALAALQDRLAQIERKRAQLMDLGFLDQEREKHKPPPRLDESKLDVLAVYIDDTEGKLAVFDRMAQKVQLFTDAVNKRFKYKRMSISREEGFTFRSLIDDTPIPLGSLSSGEQHEIVLLYELLFKIEPDTLVLIDEPEISLHLAWQQQFLGDLVEMAKLSAFDVLVATHSPAIIGKRWDLTVELKGPDLELESAAQ
jgi:predicted ATP-binding protein involved in virulence